MAKTFIPTPAHAIGASACLAGVNPSEYFIMSTIDNTTTTSAPAPAPAPVKAKRIIFNERHALGVLFPEKGAARVEQIFDALAPIFSTYLVTGGNSQDFAESSPKHGALVAKLWACHSTGKGNAAKLGKAWAACAVHIKTIKGSAFEYDQAGHDAALLDLAAIVAGFFPVSAPVERAKPTDWKTLYQESDIALKAALQEVKALKAALKAQAEKHAPIVNPEVTPA